MPIDVDVVLGRLGPKLETELAQWFPADRVEAMSERYRAHYWDRCVGDGTILLAGARGAVNAVRTRRPRDRGDRKVRITRVPVHRRGARRAAR